MHYSKISWIDINGENLSCETIQYNLDYTTHSFCLYVSTVLHVVVVNALSSRKKINEQRYEWETSFLFIAVLKEWFKGKTWFENTFEIIYLSYSH